MASHQPDSQPAAPTSAAPAPAEPGWGTWLSSMANSAYETVAGASDAPQDFDDLAPTQLGGDMDGAADDAFADVDSAERQALWKQLLSVVGMDVMNMRLSLPIWLFEPSTALTRMVETFEYSALLDRAAAEKDPLLRDALVAAFVVSAFAHTERVRKPFNPVLGETFSFKDEGTGLKFIAEQVSHHPPISVSSCQGKGWEAGESVDIKATYMGNSIEIANAGPQARRFIKFTETGDVYTWNLPNAVVTNLFIGTTFVDHYGSIQLTNTRTNATSHVTLEKCGWFSAGRYQVTGEIVDTHGKALGSLSGFWNQYLDFERAESSHGEGAMRLWMAGKHVLSDEEGGAATGALPMFTHFGKKVLAVDEESKLHLPACDSRLRPDRAALEALDKIGASEAKGLVEQAQRDRRAKMEEEGVTHKAKWFEQVKSMEKSSDGEEEVLVWRSKGDYWAFVENMTEEQRTDCALW